jgi:hypothetical protein
MNTDIKIIHKVSKKGEKYDVFDCPSAYNKPEGKVYSVPTINSRCPDCGDIVNLKKYISIDNKKTSIIIGFCECNSVLIGWRPKTDI